MKIYFKMFGQLIWAKSLVVRKLIVPNDFTKFTLAFKAFCRLCSTAVLLRQFWSDKRLVESIR